MPPKAQVLEIIDELKTLAQGLGEISDLDEHISRLTTDRDSCNATLAEIKRELANSQAGLARAQAENQKRYEQDIFTKQGELKSLTERVSTMRLQIDEASRQIDIRGAELKRINAAIEEARRKIA